MSHNSSGDITEEHGTHIHTHTIDLYLRKSLICFICIFRKGFFSFKLHKLSSLLLLLTLATQRSSLPGQIEIRAWIYYESLTRWSWHTVLTFYSDPRLTRYSYTFSHWWHGRGSWVVMKWFRSEERCLTLAVASLMDRFSACSCSWSLENRTNRCYNAIL